MSPSPPPALLSLSDPRACRPEHTGEKAARLASLLQAGHPVPAAVVLTTPGAAAWTAGAMRNELRAAVSELGFPGAVRSSGVAEDLAGASFAGAYETVLEVGAGDALDKAVVRCLDSARSARVAAYRAERAIAAAPMAVLVQRMVPATAAGVAFTADPVTEATMIGSDTVEVDRATGLVASRGVLADGSTYRAERYDGCQMYTSVRECETLAARYAEIAPLLAP